ncbi:MAG: putative RecB family exonuclease [Candidatus Woesearchaeota archaeon]|nr:putative RecB family exonuclease [Candidatus Woesearchaeota archaeon]
MSLYSHSRILTFETCPLKYKYSYIDKLEAMLGNTIEAFLGSIVHRILEKLYTDLSFQKIPTKNELIDEYNKEWEKRYDDSIVIVRKEYDPENYRKMGEEYLANYYEHYFPFNESKTIGCEMKVKIELSPKYILQGYIDRLAYKGDGIYEIHDYKTSGHLPSQEEIDNDRQLALYSIAVKRMFSDAKKIHLVWHYLAFDKELRTEKSDQDLEDLKKSIIEKIQEIEACQNFEPKESVLCNWCEYQPICPRRKHLFQNEDISPEEFLEEDGVQLANLYQKLSEKKKELDEELEEVRTKIYKYCKENGIDTIYGSSIKIKVWEGESIKITNDEEKKRQLAEILKQIKLYDELVSIDSYKLSKMIKSGKINQINESLLMPFIEKKQIFRLYPSLFEWPKD